MKKYSITIACCLQALFCSAQNAVAVRDEPRHHNIFQNAFVRVLDVHIAPGDTTQFHKHQTPSVFIVLNTVKTGSEVIIEERKATALSRDTAISFEGFYTTPRIHRVWNEDTAEFHVMDVELLNKQPQAGEAPIQQQGFQLLFDEKPVCAYRLTLAAGTNRLLQRQAPYLIIGLTDALQPAFVNSKTFSKRGDYIFIPANQAIRFTNEDQRPYAFAVLELK